ncbi:MAG: IS21-like element helper ATPase IstB [Pseudomonadales bacterium]|jgi:DNA replication protein DnaC|nr:IS21-like element helper ATPase IstB [Pseudomonadales bacterium]MDP6471404.1 IS21-like element helper ATPase IstB [Pseudomonadales bacterium]MDP6826404.1 IS21-like element helper ATPase IstB [Pseudomonadales bacterium]MDP6970957.1 IS21-like element helper ATPase IstB [Pseudomonadales bacterium]|tara:strand:- start:310 stop:1065 length:756 start_codon:yes stop_codon:yes gene_type:complete
MTASALELRLKAFRLPSFLSYYAELAQRAGTEGWDHVRYLDELATLEAADRVDRRVTRLLKASKLPRDKTLSNLELKRLPPTVRGQVKRLCDGEFLTGATNVCIFGNPGTGKTHAMAAIGHELVRQGHSVLFTPVSALVERLLVAKRDLRLSRELKRLDRIDCLALDDIGYVQQDRDEMEVLFTLLAERYERKSVMITSNLVFSKWDQIFKDPMTTAAAVDRVVHHAVIMELNVESYRAEAAKRRARQRTK